MKSFRSYSIAGAALLLVAAIGAQGNLTRWLQDVEAQSKFDAVFFKSVALPSGSVAVRRPPAETRAELGKLIQAAPAEADLYSLRALEAESQLDFAAAEADWKKYVETAADKAMANIALADYYHRRLQPREEQAALNAAATQAAYARSIQLIHDQALEPALAVEQYKTWVKRYPKETAVYAKALDFLNDRKEFGASQEVIDVYRAAFPEDREYAARAMADIEFARGNTRRAAEIWEQAFDPEWPGSTLARYFDITGAGKDRELLGRLQQQASQKPEDLAASAKIFHLQIRLNNVTGARRTLFELRGRKKNWTAKEWLTLGRLFEQSAMPDEAARSYHALFGLDNERGIAELARLLLDMPDQPIQFGAGELALYRDIATMDQGPGYLNGVLSLVLNSEGVAWKYDQQNQAARAYFHRVKASELVDLLAKRFPNAEARGRLSGKLIQTYATYGDRQGVIRAGRRFLQAFPASQQRVSVTFLMADAFAATNQVNDELASYDAILKELATAAKGMPVGSGTAVRQPDYVRALDRYVARLVALKRLPQALTVYKQEIDRNGNDPGLYERFAAFLEQNKLGAEEEAVYRQALQKFKDDTWSNKLARWYLRRKQFAQFEALTRDVTKTFSGTALESYFRDLVASSGVGNAVTLQLNLYASQRFPHNLTFVRNLLTAYQSRGTEDSAAYERLLRQHWFEADDLRSRFFQLLSRTNRLQAELDAIRALNAKPEENPVASQLLAEGEIWRTRYESAAAPMKAMAAVFPADANLDARAAMLHRSLNQPDVASNIEQNLAKASPRDSGVLTRLGEMQADRERFANAKPYWEKIPSIEPGKADGVLETATLYWDYFQFDDALRTIDAGRRKLGDNAMGAYESGAIRENQRDYGKAVDEYLRGALADDGEKSKTRLLRLARRRDLKDSIDRLIAARGSAAEDAKAIDLRIALLESQSRRADLEQYLTGVVSRTSNRDVLARAETAASLNAMPAIERRAMERRVELAPDAMEQLRARLQLMRFLEARNDAAGAKQIVEEAYRQNPVSMGVIRTAVNFHSRSKDSKRAVAILLEAASRAKGSLPSSFRFEAARKAIEAGDYAAAKPLIDHLLQAEPARPDYLAVGADYYARQNDDAGLRTFYANAITTLRAANQPVDSLRRNLIPVLARQKDFNGAVDQYIELVNRFPEDDSLAREAARFSAANGMQAKLTGFYTKATSDSPKDYRWPLVLSRLQAEFNDLDGSLASLAKATAIRPDRTDLMIARARIEERSLRFEDALKSYQKIWDLSYHDPAWLEKVGEQHLRAGRTDQAIAAVRQAYVDNQPENAAYYTLAARRFLDWNLVAAAKELAPKATPELQATIALRLRQAPPLSNASLEGAVGTVVPQYYTPKEKSAFAAAIRTAPRSLAIAQAAGLKDVEAAILAGTVKGDNYFELVNLQRDRGRFDELGQQLEALGRNPVRAGEHADAVLGEAARAFNDAGNTAGEMRVLAQLAVNRGLGGEQLSRYGILMVRQQQGQAAALAGDPKVSASLRDALATASVFAAKPADTFAILAGRGKGRPPVWTSAYTALAGVYLGAGGKDSLVKQSFEAALGTQVIGEQLARKPDRDLQLTGKDWFYYAARYGENVPGAEEFAVADLESSPATARLYVQLGDFYFERGEFAKARTEYEYALQLQPQLAEAMRKSALAMHAAGQRDEALAAWRAALTNERVNLQGVLEDLAVAKMIEPLHAEVDRALRQYLRRSGGYEADAMLHSLGGDLAWMLDIVNAAREPLEVLSALFDANWLTPAQRTTVIAVAVQAADRKVQSSLGEARQQAVAEAAKWRAEQAGDFVDRGDFASAAPALQNVPAEVRAVLSQRFDELAIRVAAAQGKLDTASAGAVALETLEQIAATPGLDEKTAAMLLEFGYTRELSNYRYSAGVFLGLAKIRLQQGNVPAAMELLRRMNNTVGEPFTVTDLAGDLLLQQGRPQEAKEFLESLAKARPWDAKAKLLLARVSGNEAQMKAVAESSDAPYAIRCDAALAIRAIKGAALQTPEPELNLLSAQAAVTEQQASASPYSVELRKLAASQTKDVNVKYRLQLGMLAARPADSAARRGAFQSAIASRRFQAAAGILNANRAETQDLPAIVDAYLRMGRNSEATEAARRLVEAHAPGARRLAELARSAFELQRLNEQRMPVFQEHYDQDRVVRPRLAALPRRGGAQ